MNNSIEQSKKLYAIEIARQYIEEGKDIPFEINAILFPPDKRECDLSYFGKQSAEEILSNIAAVPLQVDRVFPKESVIINNDWTNKLIFGENSQILKSLIQMKKDGKLKNSDGTDGVKLIYIDPPFATKQDFKISGSNQVAYADKLSSADFIEFLRKRLILAKELLADDGVIFVHLDGKMCHYIKIIMDEIFGKNNFRNEIIWCYTGPSQTSKYFTRKHDNIMFYSKSENYTFNTENCRVPYKKSTASSGKTSFTGVTSAEKVIELDNRGKLIEDWWNDIAGIGYSHKEITKYPTQKPEALLSRIIRAVTNEGDIVLDFFAGSGTTPVVAERLKRRWVAIDVGKYSIYIIQKRLLSLGEITPFVLYSAGLYDVNKINQFDSENWKMFALQLWGCQIEKSRIKGLSFDGYKDNCLVKVYSPQDLDNKKMKISYETINDLNMIIGKNAGSEIFIIAPQGQFDFAEDDVETKDRIYHILRVPYSLLAKFTEKFTPIIQPKAITSVNETVDAVGFDFIQPPTVDFFIDQNQLIIKNFRSNSRIKGEQNSEISMILIDYDYNGEYFDLDEQIFNSDIYEVESKTKMKKLKSGIKIREIKTKAMIIFVDNSGNEKKVIINGKG